MTRDKWERRIQRADELAAAHPFAAEGLRFYAGVAGFQQSFYGGLAALNGEAKQVRPPGSLCREPLELPALLPWFASFLSLVGDIAPPPLAQSAAELNVQGEKIWRRLLNQFWMGMTAMSGLDPAEGLLAWAFLQPYAEYLADHTEPLETHGTPSHCPLCLSVPLVGVLRPQGDGGKRSLICSLCAREWDFRRIVCLVCNEESVDKLPVYVAEELPHIRVEACDTCHCYLKTIDLTKDGHAVPAVDELAAIPLSLWAAENGYDKVTPSLLGV